MYKKHYAILKNCHLCTINILNICFLFFWSSERLINIWCVLEFFYTKVSTIKTQKIWCLLFNCSTSSSDSPAELSYLMMYSHDVNDRTENTIDRNSISEKSPPFKNMRNAIWMINWMMSSKINFMKLIILTELNFLILKMP